MSEHAAYNSDEEKELTKQANEALFRIRAQNLLAEQGVGDNMVQNLEEFENLEPLTGSMFDEHDVDFSDTPFAAGMAVWDMMKPSGWYGPLKDEKEEEERLSGDKAAIHQKHNRDSHEKDQSNPKRRRTDSKPSKVQKGDDDHPDTSPNKTSNKGTGMKVDAKNHSQWEPELKQLFKICTEGVNRPDPGRQWSAYLETCPEETKFLTNAQKTSSGKAAFDFRPHRREAIGLLRQAEQSNHRGAILADDMGLGKTITAIGLDQIYPIGRPTLIILPGSLIPMWKSEYESLCGPSLKVYHHTGAVKINGAQLSSKRCCSGHFLQAGSRVLATGRDSPELHPPTRTPK
ncbi:hypothetical protein DL95DRAFT_407305 [Leptodontidium sp. 2 PMI_412]|nr:hypothetical protein DL95DRAFT_407305 [Leptodontidium sp. 2 PMI_412]